MHRDGIIESNRSLIILWGGIFTLVTAWLLVSLEPRSTGDTFIWLASGRDTLMGRQGHPDEWSFLTEGRVWIDQNWGTGVLFYWAHELVGSNGIVAIKALCIALMSISLIGLLRARGTSWALAMLVSAAVVLVLRYYIDLRANMFTLAFIPTLAWLMARAHDDDRYLWLSVGLIVPWANIHGGYVFGLGMLGLWSICEFVGRSLKSLSQKQAAWSEWRQVWKWPAATIAAIILAATLNPFGIDNILHPLTMLSGDGQIWRTVSEWMPPLGKSIPNFGHPSSLFVILGLLGGLGTAWGCRWLWIRGSKQAPSLGRFSISTLFDVALAVVGFSMALTAVRFIPIAVLSAAPLVGRGLARWLDHPRLNWVTAGLLLIGVATEPFLTSLVTAMRVARPDLDPRAAWLATTIVLTLAPVLITVVMAMTVKWRRTHDLLYTHPPSAWPVMTLTVLLLFTSVSERVPALSRHYADNNPLSSGGSLFDRMVFAWRFPEEAVEFLNDNDIHGNVFHEWKWEGYLRWARPELKLHIGGRAQSIYSPKEYQRYLNLIHGKTSLFAVREIGANLIVLPASPLIHRWTETPGTGWKPIYYDGKVWVLVNVNDPGANSLFEKALLRELHFRDPAVARSSRAHALTTNLASRSDPGQLEELILANRSRPFPENYIAYTDLHRRLGRSMDELIEKFEDEVKRLEAIDYRHLLQGSLFAESLYTLTQILTQACESAGRLEEARRWRSYSLWLKKAWNAALNGEMPPPFGARTSRHPMAKS